MRHEIITCDWCGEAPPAIQQLRIGDKSHDMCSACMKLFTETLEKSGIPIKEPLYPIGQLGISAIQPATISWPAGGNGQWQGNVSGSSLVLPSVTTTGTLIPSNTGMPNNGVTYYVSIGPANSGTSTT